MSDPALPSSPLNAGHSRRALREWLLLVAVLLAVGAYAGYASWQERSRIGNYERRRLETQIRTLDDRIGSQLTAVAGALDGVRNAPEIFDRTDPGSMTSRRLKALVRLVPGVHDIQLVDADGTVRAATEPAHVGRNVGLQPFFLAARSRATSGRVLVGW